MNPIFNNKKLIYGLLVFLGGLLLATYLHWQALNSPGIYKSDIRQAIHWAAYHQTSFKADDLILKYNAFNESPLQNLIYYVGTYFVDMVFLTKILAVLSYAAAVVLFFIVGCSLFNLRTGLLMALFFSVFPDQFTYSGGFFSKFWAIPLLLMTVYLLKTKNWRAFFVLMPFCALAYPAVIVLLGIVAGIYMVLLFFDSKSDAKQLFIYLSLGSLLALGLLLFKYGSPPAEIGGMTESKILVKMPEMYRGGLVKIPILPTRPLSEDILKRMNEPFTIALILLFLVGLRRRVYFDKTLLALILGSMICYKLADYFFMHLYLPVRYTRYSYVVLFVVWCARNIDLLTLKIKRRSLVIVFLIAVIGFGLYQHKNQFKTSKSSINRTRFLPLNQFIKSLPDGVLMAGPPKYMDDVTIQARKSVLVNFKSAHPWFIKYYTEVKERTMAVYRALYATHPDDVNQLHTHYGVDYFVVGKDYFVIKRLKGKKTIHAKPYDKEILKLTRKHKKEDFILNFPPQQNVVYLDKNYAVVRLPLKH